MNCFRFHFFIMFLAYSVSRLVLGKEAAMNLPDCFLKLAGAGNEANENSLWTEKRKDRKGRQAH